MGSLHVRRPSRPASLVGWLLVVILALGALERFVMLFAYTPAILSYPDTILYAQGADGPIFLPDPLRPAGYATILWTLNVFGGLELVVVIQHLIGLLTAWLAFRVFRTLGAPGGVALVPAAALALAPDLLYFEHSLLSETAFTCVLMAMLLVTAKAARRPADAPLRPVVLLAAGGGVLLAVTVMIRGAGLFAIPPLALALLFVPGWAGRRRIAVTGAFLAATIAGLLVYAGVQRTQIDYFGVTEGSGWAWYSRAAPIADCSKFTPPKGTEGLCQTTDWRTRPGPDFYSWGDGSPGRALFIGPPFNSDKVGSWGKKAILAEPDLYVRSVVKDLARYVSPDIGYDRVGSGAGPWQIDVAARSTYDEPNVEAAIKPVFGSQHVTTHGAMKVLSRIQKIVRVHGLLILLSTLLVAAGLAFGRPRTRIAMLFTGGVALSSVVLSVATTVYSYRYAVPFLPLLLGGGVWAAWDLGERLWHRRAARADPADGPATDASTTPGSPVVAG